MNSRQPSSQAQAYQRYSVEVILGPLAKLLVEAARLRRGEQILDLACGTGAVSRLAARAVGTAGRVTGLDIDADSLAVAQAMPPERAVIEWRHGHVGALPFADAAFDVALCSQGLQFFPDRVQALCELSRVLVPRGRFAGCVWQSRERNPYYQALKEALHPHIAAGTAARMEAPFGLADSAALREAFIQAHWDVEIRPISVALRMPSLDEFIPGHMAAMSLAEDIRGLSGAAVQEVIQGVKHALRSYQDEQGLRVPFAVQIALARRAQIR